MMRHGVLIVFIRSFGFVLLLLCGPSAATGCARCYKTSLHSDTDLDSVINLIEKNAVILLRDADPPESPLLKTHFDTEIRFKRGANNKTWLCSIKRKYIGGGGLIVWGTKDRNEKEISIRIEWLDGRTAIHVEECLSSNTSEFAIGHRFTDELVPLLYQKYNGTIEIRYEDGKLYSTGNLAKGQRQGEWKWWWPDGELMQTVTYMNGKYEGERRIRVKRGSKYEEFRYKYINGQISWRNS